MITDLKINAERKQLYYEKGYWTDKTIGDVWADQVASHPERTYVTDDQGSSYTYGEIDDRASRLASWMTTEGVEPGDVVTFQVPIWAEFCIVYVACLKCGAVMHPVPPNFNDEDLVYNMNKVSARAFICPTEFHHCDFVEQAYAVKERIPSLKAIAFIDKKAPAPDGAPCLSDICARFEPITAPPVSSDDVACILSTSGTTGRQKAVLFTHNNILFSERSFVKGLGRTADDVMFMPSPLNHATGFYHGLISPMILGGRTVLQEHFDAARAFELCNREGVTWSMGATPFIYDILRHLEGNGLDAFDTLRLFVCGGAPVPSTLVQCAHAHGILLCECYGSTESCPHAFVPPERCLEWNGAWSGVPLPGIEVRVVDAERRDVPNGEQGEEISRGPHQFVGYLNDKERTDRALDDEGWFYSGDLCYMDEEGRIRINGRKKEIIIRGGENICANEIDENLMGCPGIGDHATIGMPDERLGERICTFAVATGETRPELADITGFLADRHVAKRLWPERIEYIDAIPKTATGKVKRHLLAAELAERMRGA